MTTKQEIFKEELEEYLRGSKADKTKILNSVCDITKVNRKSAVRRFKTLRDKDSAQPEKRGRNPLYGKGVTAALKEVWEIANRICAERLKEAIPRHVEILKRDKMWKHRDQETQLLLRMSLATIKRRLNNFEHIKKGGGRGTTKPSNLKEVIPIRRGPWHDPPPGMGEIDTVAHCGYTIAGNYCYTVQYTDVATVWTCLAGQWNKGEVETQKSISRIKDHLPFPLRGIDPDSGSEFINWHLKGWCDERQIQMTRTRPYMKNDHARIEQKNYTNVRQIVGYSRFDNPKQAEVLSELYDVLEDYINFFLPSMVCVEKIRTKHSRTRRRYDTPATAYQRVLDRTDISEEIKEKLQQKYAKLNPKILKQKYGRILRKLSKSSRRLR